MYFFSGQVLSASTLNHHVSVELIHEGYKYKTQVTKSGQNSYFLIMNGSFKEIEVHRLSDGGKYWDYYVDYINLSKECFNILLNFRNFVIFGWIQFYYLYARRSRQI